MAKPGAPPMSTNRSTSASGAGSREAPAGPAEVMPLPQPQTEAFTWRDRPVHHR